jgi:hypothetical protein
MSDQHRTTLIVRRPGTPARAWYKSVTGGGSELLFVDSMSFVSQAVQRSIDEHRDINRVIIDRTGTPLQLLQLLTTLPHQFLGDVLFIQDGDGSFLSAVGRGGDRILYSLFATDVDFYLKTLELVGEEHGVPMTRLASG